MRAPDAVVACPLSGAMLFPALVRMAAPLGMPSVLLTLLDDEQVTNASYDDAVE